MNMALPFLDDLVIHSRDVDGHLVAMRAVFKAYLRAGLRLNPLKCHLLKESVTYLGHNISSQGISPCKDYIEVVRNWPMPRTRTQLRGWMGKVGYYRKFIKDFAAIANPLFAKLKKDNGLKDDEQYEVTEPMEKAFETLKQKLIHAPVLAYPRFHDLDQNPFILTVDWSSANNAVGGVLSQVQENVERPIAYAARRLNPTQSAYSATKGELCALLLMLQVWAQFLILKPFKVRTDHAALTWLRNFRQPTGALARWQQQLEQYDFKIEYRPGKSNVVADALSRAEHLEHDPADNTNPFGDEDEYHTLNVVGLDLPYLVAAVAGEQWTPRMLREAQEADEDLSKLRRFISSGRKPQRDDFDEAPHDLKTYFGLFSSLYLDRHGVLRYKYEVSGAGGRPTVRNLLVLPQEIQVDALRLIHEKGAHMAAAATVARALRHVYCPQLLSLAQLVVRRCKNCQLAQPRPKHQRHTLYSALQGYPMQRLCLDYVGPLCPSTKGNIYILTILDSFSRWIEAFPTKRATAKNTVEVLTREIFPRFGVPESIHSDRGTHFTAALVDDVCEALSIHKTHTVSYNPKANRVERSHRTLGRMLKALTAGQQNKWEEYLPQALHAMRSTVNRSTGYAPYSLIYGKDPPTELDLIFAAAPVPEQFRTADDYAVALKARLQQAHAWARKNITNAVRRQRRAYTQARNTFQPGQRVWLFTPKLKVGQSSKLAVFWTGPWTVQRAVNDLTFEIAPHPQWLRKNLEIVSIDRLRPFYAADDDEDNGGEPPEAGADLSMPGDEMAEFFDARETQSDSDSDDDSDAEYGFADVGNPPPPPQQPPPPPPPATPPGEQTLLPATPPGAASDMEEFSTPVARPPDDSPEAVAEPQPDVAGGSAATQMQQDATPTTAAKGGARPRTQIKQGTAAADFPPPPAKSTKTGRPLREKELEYRLQREAEAEERRQRGVARDDGRSQRRADRELRRQAQEQAADLKKQAKKEKKAAKDAKITAAQLFGLEVDYAAAKKGAKSPNK